MIYDLVITSLPGLKKDKPAPGPTFIKAFLEPLGYAVKVVDGHKLGTLQDIKKEISKYQFRWLGISVFSFLQVDDALKLAEPFDNVVFGGAGVDMGWPTKNFLVGQGEHTLVEFLKGNFNFPGINGIPSLATILETTKGEEKIEAIKEWRKRVGNSKAKQMAMSAIKTPYNSQLKIIKEHHKENNSLWQVYLRLPDKSFLHSSNFRNKPIVVFNSASLCGKTKQLSAFEELYQTGKIIPVAIPTNEFGQQEPGDNKDIGKNYAEKYGVTFPILEKVDLTHPFFKTFGMPDWNFNKWLFCEDHLFVQQHGSKVMPMDLVGLTGPSTQSVSVGKP